MPKRLNIKMLKFRRGFTLLELLIVLTAFILMITSLAANYRANQKSVVDSVVQEIVSVFKEVQQKSLGKNIQNIIEAADCPNGSCIFGVNFPSSSGGAYYIFVDSNQDYFYNPSDDKILETKELPKGIRYAISDFSNLTYESPYGAAHIIDSSGLPVNCSANCNLQIISDRDNITIDIKINDQGLIYIDL